MWSSLACLLACALLRAPPPSPAQDAKKQELPKVGEVAPAFELRDDGDQVVTLEEFLGKKVVLAFYPKDFTPG